MKQGFEMIWCPLCGETVHQRYAHPIATRATISSRSDLQVTGSVMQLMVEESNWIHDEILQAAEEACVLHVSTRHRLRYRAWKRWRRNWMLTFRWPRLRAPEVQMIHEPQKFLS